MSTESKENQSLKELATVMGGVEIEVRLKAKGQRSKEEPEAMKVWIEQLPIRKYPELQRFLEDEERLIGLYTGDEKLAEQLTRAGQERVIEVGREINWDFFCLWRDRRPKRDPDENLKVFEVMAKANPDLVRELISKAMPDMSTTRKEGGERIQQEGTERAEDKAKAIASQSGSGTSARSAG